MEKHTANITKKYEYEYYFLVYIRFIDVATRIPKAFYFSLIK